SKVWSKYQKAIFDDIARGKGHTQVIARAGSGKTSTIVEGFYHIPKGMQTLMVAFNKSIQQELAQRAPGEVKVLTLHGLGYQAVRSAFPKVGSPDTEKLYRHITAQRGDDAETFDVRTSIAKTVSLCKGYLADTFEKIDDVMDKHGIDTCGDPRKDFIDTVLKVLDTTKKDNKHIDFDDMIWFPNVYNLSLPKFDNVFIDEAQDLNSAQINIALNSIRPNGRILSVGDDRQAIYGFRGADSNAIQNIIERLNAKTLPLSVTYRCAKNIVKLAQTIVPDLEAYENAPDGIVDQVAERKLIKLIKPGDFVLSRANAPLVKYCLAALRAQIPANIQGRDMGKSLAFMIKQSKKRSVNAFLEWLEEWKVSEINRLTAAKRDISAVVDKAECLIALSENAKTLKDIQNNIDKLFNDVD